MTDTFTLPNYQSMLRELRKRGYSFQKFEDQNLEALKLVALLRHDVDFSLTNALGIARLEAQEDITSSFFFPLRYPLYNILSVQAQRILTEIHQLGHSIGLHFDPSLYSNIVRGVQDELQVFSSFYPFMNRQVISLHKAGSYNVNLRQIIIQGVSHTYESKYFVPGRYFSDSRGMWGKDGSPTDSETYLIGDAMQIVTHPMWWAEPGNTNIEKLGSYIISVREKTVEYLEESTVTLSLEDLK